MVFFNFSTKTYACYYIMSFTVIYLYVTIMGQESTGIGQMFSYFQRYDFTAV